MIPTKEQIEEIACLEQRTPDWFRARLGCVTGSCAHLVVKPNEAERAYKKALLAGPIEIETKSAFNSRLKEIKKTNPEKYQEEYDKGLLKESEEQFKSRLKTLWDKAQQSGFNDSTMSYLYQIASERNLRDVFVNNDIYFEEYQKRVSVSSHAMRWGAETEEMARLQYSRTTGYEVVEVGFHRHETVDWFGDSPDGLVVDEEGKPIGAIEIKCPKPDMWIRYRHAFNQAQRKYNEYVKAFMESHPEIDADAFTDEMLPIEQRLCTINSETLKNVRIDYYWQCQSHCECNKVPWCDFVFYDQMQKGEIMIVRINRNDEDIDFLLNRIELVNNYIDNDILA